MGLMGCIYVPATRQLTPDGQQRPESLIGKATSSKPLKLGKTSIVDALVLLRGTSVRYQRAIDDDSRFYAHESKRQVAMMFEVVVGRWFTICGNWDSSDGRLLVIDFDDAGLITGYHTLSDWSAGDNGLRPLRTGDGLRLFGPQGVRAMQEAGLLLTDAELQRRADDQRAAAARRVESLRQQYEYERRKLDASSQPATRP